MNSGIYFIRNIVNDKFYIGSAVNFDSRWSRHKHDLKNDTHHCTHLQHAWNKYGEQAFLFEKYEYVETDKLIKIEQTYLDKYYDYGLNCYNTCPTAGSWLGMKHSEENKKLFSKQKQGSNNIKAKLTEQNVQQIKQYLFENELMIQEIAIIFNIDKTIISKMISGERWKHCFTDEERAKLQQLQQDNRQKRMNGNNNPMFDAIISDKTRSKISNSLKGKMIGTKNPMTKLTEENVIAIKNELQRGELTQKEISKIFNVSQCTIAEINTGKRWAHVKSA
jgi:predicted XRE-type DNA-binding protein